jgi:hypothetical protein
LPKELLKKTLTLQVSVLSLAGRHLISSINLSAYHAICEATYRNHF